MAKDTEKLIRQLSLISYLMAERRPVTALEIRRDVEGYSGMNEDAFARRFYADRSELESLGIHLTVDKPIDGVAEQENYSLRPENFHLSAIAFTDEELASLQFALTLLDGEFAYAEPLRLALQQISWGRPSPLQAPDQRGLALGITGSAGGHDLSQRLAKIETAIFRQKTITFDYYTMERDDLGARKVDPYHLLFRGGQFYVLGRSHERDALRVFRLSRIQGKVAYATKAEHDFKRPKDFDPREYANRADWQYGERDRDGRGVDLRPHRVARRAPLRALRRASPRRRTACSSRPATRARASSRAWALSLGEHARVEGPAELVDVVAERVARLAELHEAEPLLAAARGVDAARGGRQDALAEGNGRREAAIRPERFARLVTLASILIEAGRAGERLREEDVCERLQITGAELREDVNVLNVVNFGGGSYVLYAEVADDGWIEVDPEPYSDNFARPARLLPVEAKALVAAIDLIGEHLPEGALTSAREKIVAALGADPMEQGLQIASAGGDDSVVARVVSEAIVARHLLRLEYYKANEDEFSERTVEPYALINGREGWYVACFDPAKDDVRHFRLDRIKTAEVLERAFKPRPEVDPAADVEGWPRTGEVEASRTARRVDLARARALGARGAHRRAGARGRGARRRARASPARTGSCARCSRRPATPPCWSRPRRARPYGAPWPAFRSPRALSGSCGGPDGPRYTARRCDVLPSGSRSTLGARSAVAGAAAQQIVGRRFTDATHDVVRGRPRGRPRLGGARRRRAGPTLLAVQRQRGLGLAGREPRRERGRGLRQPVRVQRDRARQPAHAARRPRQRRLGADLVGGDHRQPRERDRRAPGRRRHRPRREPRRPAPARRGDHDARRPRRQRAGLRQSASRARPCSTAPARRPVSRSAARRSRSSRPHSSLRSSWRRWATSST